MDRMPNQKLKNIRKQQQISFRVLNRPDFLRLDGLRDVEHLHGHSCTVAARSQGQVGRVQGAGKCRLEPQIIRIELPRPSVLESTEKHTAILTRPLNPIERWRFLP